MKTSQHQFDLLVTFMEENGDLSKPSSNARGRMVAFERWEELASLLNSDGSGDTKPTDKWKKVWSDFKNNTKKKAARLHRAASGTGGGPATYARLTDLEQRVLNVIGMQAATGLEIAEAGLTQAVLVCQPELTQPGVQEAHSNRVDESHQPWNEPGPSSQIHFEPQPSSQTHLERPTVNMDLPRPVVSPYFINIQEEIIENTEDLNVTPAPSSHQSHVGASISQAQPALFGETTPSRRGRAGRNRIQPSPRRRVRSHVSHTDQVAEHFLSSDRDWKAFRMQQHRDYIDIKREQNRIREVELQTQREWQAVGLRALDILDKLVSKFCKD